VNPTRQTGMTFWGLLVIAALVVAITLLFFKLLPPYIEDGKVVTALENVAKQPGVADMDKGQIKAALQRRFDIDDITRANLEKDLTVEKKPGVMTIRIKYEVRVPIAYNVTALLDFDHGVQVNVR
jgi:hypothetical protein